MSEQMSERERLREAIAGNITYESVYFGEVDDLLDAILEAGFGDKAAAWDEGRGGCEDQMRNFETISNPYRAKEAE